MMATEPSASLSAELNQRRRRAHRKLGPLAIAVVLQALLLVGSVGVVVVLPNLRDDPEFAAAKTIYLPQRQLEHQAAVAEFERAASAPMAMEKLTSESLLPQDLPDLPALPSETFAELESEVPAPNAEGLLQGTGLLAALGGLDAGSSTFNFLGVEDEASRIVIAFDISTSVVNAMNEVGMEIDQLLAETKRVIGTMNANTLVNIIQFSRNYEVFSSYPIPATQANKEALKQWLDREFVRSGRSQPGWTRGNPNGIQLVLEAAFEMDPDVIIVLSDASFQRSVQGLAYGEDVPWEELEDDIERWQEGRTEPVRIHVVGFSVEDEDADGARDLARRNDGKYREF